MKPDIHPNYNQVLVKCACSHEFYIYSSLEAKSINTEICNACHPVYTGQQKTATITGRVENFNRKFQQRPQPKVNNINAIKKTTTKKPLKKITVKKSNSDQE